MICIFTFTHFFTIPGDDSWEYYRVNSTDGTLEVHTFWPHGCYDHYKRLRYYCAPSKGVKVAANVGGTEKLRTGQNLWGTRTWVTDRGRRTFSKNKGAGLGGKKGVLILLRKKGGQKLFDSR